MADTSARGGKRPRGGGAAGRGRSSDGRGHTHAHTHTHGRGKVAEDGGGTAVVKLSTRRREEAELAALAKRIESECPPPGSMEVEAKEFRELPLCAYTLTGLDRAKFRVMTQIQRVAIPHALAGRDVLGAAKTGSGKTLAFLVPVLEALHRHRFSSGDGCGAIVISPTRELCAQIFEVLRSVAGAHFSMSAGMVCGGKSFEEESAAIGQLNLVVATPGRLLQHLEQSPEFDVSNVRVLVLDEADRLLDMGFSETLNGILSFLPGPPTRQTMLFSATQTKSVRDLARLSLREPQYLSVHEKASTATPAKLAQTYVVVKLEDKLNMLYSFIRSHLTSKIIVFVSSCKQSRYLFESFRRLRPGVPLQLLHGKMKQERRTLVYYDFLKKPACVLFATDIAARGLDFPAVDWVVQLDCPEDTATYIHRVGRTARFRSKGHGLLVLLPSEAPGMTAALEAAKVPIKQVHIAPSAAFSVTNKLAAEVAADPDLKYLAQRAFASYIRSVLLQGNKEIFDVRALPLEAYSESLGLATMPVVKINPKALDATTAAEIRADAHRKKNENKALARLKASIAAKKAKRNSTEDASDASGDERILDEDSEEVDDDEDDNDEDEDDMDTSDEEDDTDADDASSSASENELLQPRASADNAAAPDDAMDTDEDTSALPDSLTRRERERIQRIDRMSKAMGAGAKGKDGLTRFERIAAEKSGAGATKTPLTKVELELEAAKHAKRIAERLSAVAERDREHDKLRVRQKHREERRRARGLEDEDADDAGDDDERAVLLKRAGDGADSHGSGDEEVTDASESSSDSSHSGAKASAVVAARAKAGAKRTRDEAAGAAGDIESAALQLLSRRRAALI